MVCVILSTSKAHMGYIIGGCPKTNETQLGIIAGVFLAILLLIGLVLLFLLLSAVRRWLFFYSIQAEGFIPLNSERWKQYDVTAETVVPEAYESREQTYSRAASAGNVTNWTSKGSVNRQ